MLTLEDVSSMFTLLLPQFWSPPNSSHLTFFFFAVFSTNIKLCMAVIWFWKGNAPSSRIKSFNIIQFATESTK